jgi:hypothetical protein
MNANSTSPLTQNLHTTIFRYILRKKKESQNQKGKRDKRKYEPSSGQKQPGKHLHFQHMLHSWMEGMEGSIK